MKSHPDRLLRGQVLVLVVFAIFALVAFVALVVDGGTIYNARRVSQNAADASALAGASEVSKIVTKVTTKNFKCSMSNFNTARSAAVANASSNNFTIDNHLSNNNGVDVQCVEGSERYVDVTVRITHEIDVYLLHLLGLSNPTNTVEAVVRVTPRNMFADGAAIMSTKDDCSGAQSSEGGITLSGTIKINIDGTMLSNSCCRGSGMSSYVSLTEQWICEGAITPGNTNYVPAGPDFGTVDPPLADTLNAQLSAACGSGTTAPNYNFQKDDPKNPNVLRPNGQPLKIRDLSVAKNASLTLDDGLYCIFGKMDISGKIVGKNVTIFMNEDAGDIDLNGTMLLSSPSPLCEVDTPSCAPAVGGLLILYMPDDETRNPSRILNMSGNAENDYQGTIFAPKTKIKVNGNTVVPCNPSMNRSQLIAETVELNGTGQICLNYNPNFTLSSPGLLSLMR